MSEQQLDKDGQQSQADANQPQFQIQRIYVKDISFEAPHSPHIFQSEWKPAVELELNTDSKQLTSNYHEVILKVSATAKISEKIAFLVEVQMAGVFLISNFENEQTNHMLGSYCPNILFPYVREAIADIINRGGFPQFNLSPVNFDALYADHVHNLRTNATQNEEVSA